MILELAGPLPTIQVGSPKIYSQLPFVPIFALRTWKVLKTPIFTLFSPQIGFRDCMEVSKTEFVEFSLATFLANTGGSLGLWLGLGLLQLAQILVQQGAKIVSCKIC